MKKALITTILAIAAFTGCADKKEEPVQEPAPVVESVEETVMPDSLEVSHTLDLAKYRTNDVEETFWIGDNEDVYAQIQTDSNQNITDVVLYENQVIREDWCNKNEGKCRENPRYTSIIQIDKDNASLTLWERKIKASVLNREDTLSTVLEIGQIDGKNYLVNYSSDLTLEEAKARAVKTLDLYSLAVSANKEE